MISLFPQNTSLTVWLGAHADVVMFAVLTLALCTLGATLLPERDSAASIGILGDGGDSGCSGGGDCGGD